MSNCSAIDYIDKVRLIVGKSSNYIVNDEVILDLLDQNILKFVVNYGFNQFNLVNTFTTTAGDATYDINDNYRILLVREVTNTTTGNKLIKMDFKDYQIYIQGGSSSGSPTHFLTSLYGDGNTREITLYPTPDSTYTMRYVALYAPEKMRVSPSANYGPLSDIWDRALVFGVAGDISMMIAEDPARAGALYNLANQAAASAANIEFQPTQIVGRVGTAVKAGIKV